MKKILLTLFIVCPLAAVSTSALAENADHTAKERIAATAQQYILDDTARLLPRRSALVAYLLDNMASNDSLAGKAPTPLAERYAFITGARLQLSGLR